MPQGGRAGGGGVRATGGRLQERVDDAVDVVLRRVPREDQILERGYEGGGVPAQLLDHRRLNQVRHHTQLLHSAVVAAGG